MFPDGRMNRLMWQPLRLMRNHDRGPRVLLALLLGVTLVAASVHRHKPLADHDTCVICTVAQTPAIATGITPAPCAPVAAAERSPLAPASHHARRVIAGATSRAPPIG
jgi:hypothetical protein